MPAMEKLPGTRLRESSLIVEAPTGTNFLCRLELILFSSGGTLAPGRWARASFNNPQKINPISSPLVKENGFSYNAETRLLLCRTLIRNRIPLITQIRIRQMKGNKRSRERAFRRRNQKKSSGIHQLTLYVHILL